MALFQKGQPKLGGRKKGSQNKLNVGIQDAIANAFKEVGGVKYLVRIADEQPAVFCALLAKLLPKQMNVSVDANPIQLLLDDLRLRTRSIEPQQQEIEITDVDVVAEEQYIQNQQLIVNESVSDVYLSDQQKPHNKQ